MPFNYAVVELYPPVLLLLVVLSGLSRSCISGISLYFAVKKGRVLFEMEKMSLPWKFWKLTMVTMNSAYANRKHIRTLLTVHGFLYSIYVLSSILHFRRLAALNTSEFHVRYYCLS